MGYHFVTYHDYYYNYQPDVYNTYNLYLRERLRQYEQQNSQQHFQQSQLSDSQKSVNHPIIYSYNVHKAENDSSEVESTRPDLMIGIDGLIIICQFGNDTDSSIFIGHDDSESINPYLAPFPAVNPM